MCPPEIGDFDAEGYEPTRTFDPLPTDWYAMQIVDSAVEQAKSSSGQFLKLELETLEEYHPHFKGRKVWVRLNLWNPSAEAVAIANSQLSAICRAVGEMRVNQSEVLHHKPLAVKVRLRPADGKYEASNDVVGYDSLAARFGGGETGSAPTAPPAKAPAPKAPTAAPQQAPRAPAAPGGAAPKGPPPWTRAPGKS